MNKTKLDRKNLEEYLLNMKDQKEGLIEDFSSQAGKWEFYPGIDYPRPPREIETLTIEIDFLERILKNSYD